MPGNNQYVRQDSDVTSLLLARQKEKIPTGIRSETIGQNTPDTDQRDQRAYDY